MEGNLYLVSLVLFKNLGNGAASIGNAAGLVWAHSEAEALGIKLMEARKENKYAEHQLHLSEVFAVDKEDLIAGREEWFGIKKEVENE